MNGPRIENEYEHVSTQFIPLVEMTYLVGFVNPSIFVSFWESDRCFIFVKSYMYIDNIER